MRREPLLALFLGLLALSGAAVLAAEAGSPPVAAVESDDALGLAADFSRQARELQRNGRYADAQPLYEQARDIYRHAFGDGHPDVTMPLGNVAANLLDLGRAADALPSARSAVSQVRARRGHGRGLPGAAGLDRDLRGIGRRADGRAVQQR